MAIFILVSTTVMSVANSLERDISLELNAGRRLNEIQKRPLPRGEYNYASIHRTSKWPHQFNPLTSRHDTSIATRNQDLSRKIDIRAVATGIFGLGFIQFLMLLKQWVSIIYSV